MLNKLWLGIPVIAIAAFGYKVDGLEQAFTWGLLMAFVETALYVVIEEWINNE